MFFKQTLNISILVNYNATRSFTVPCINGEQEARFGGQKKISRIHLNFPGASIVTRLDQVCILFPNFISVMDHSIVF